PRTGYPDKITATGDSITRAANATLPIGEHPELSWATGTDASVNSVYKRILAANPGISGNNSNVAVSGSKMAALNAQMQAAVAGNPEYVTVVMGGNDICTSTEAGMTSATDFGTQFGQALATLSAGAPDAIVFVGSVPDMYKVWQVNRANPQATQIWGQFGICQSMFANPASDAPADEDRRQRVRQRAIDYNAQLRQICAQYIHCRYDNGAFFNAALEAADFGIDYWHPSTAGQNKLAAAAAAASFDWTDSQPPVSSSQLQVNAGQFTLALTATDNVGLAGIEYRIGAGAWTRYAAPLPIGGPTTVTFRAVDVNGNIEEDRTRVIIPLRLYLPQLVRRG
ncbi:MAG TPA: SGNH/GDSL hydrolase family protein, partial [Herpetosiphonaceae bacterium]